MDIMETSSHLRYSGQSRRSAHNNVILKKSTEQRRWTEHALHDAIAINFSATAHKNPLLQRVRKPCRVECVDILRSEDHLAGCIIQ